MAGGEGDLEPVLLLWVGAGWGGGFPPANGLTAASSWQFFEALDIRTAQKNLTLSITGRGVMPSIVCSVEEVLDMGYILAREKTTSTFEVKPSMLIQKARQQLL